MVHKELHWRSEIGVQLLVMLRHPTCASPGCPHDVGRSLWKGGWLWLNWRSQRWRAHTLFLEQGYYTLIHATTHCGRTLKSLR